MESHVIKMRVDLDAARDQQRHQLLLPVDHRVPTEPDHQAPPQPSDHLLPGPIHHRITIPVVPVDLRRQNQVPHEIQHGQGQELVRGELELRLRSLNSTKHGLVHYDPRHFQRLQFELVDPQPHKKDDIAPAATAVEVAPGEVAVVPEPRLAFRVGRLVVDPADGVGAVVVLRREAALRGQAVVDGNDYRRDLAGDLRAVLVGGGVRRAEEDPAAVVEVDHDREPGDGVVV
ncbi:hypothetical protein TorRG33x02_189970 [Trema orientale]|uniref:Uncharacterized protein n=1 Tax=Trema orientale TaxID=63057 RepID=A0A2P5EI09_TREOI|nr:hypothetical protein TorRG33x02_189970 [Trema orientale]